MGPGQAGDDRSALATPPSKASRSCKVFASCSGLSNRIRSIRGIFKVAPNNVQNHIVVQRALAGDEIKTEPKLKPADFAAYLIAIATR